MLRRADRKLPILMAGIAILSVGALACDESGGNEISVEVPLPSTPKNTSFKWDPCFQIEDSLPEDLGFDSETRQRRDWHTRYTDEEMFIGCAFDQLDEAGNLDIPRASMSIQSGNMSFQTMKERNPGGTVVAINDRTGLRISDGASGYLIVMPGPDGVVTVRLSCAENCDDSDPLKQVDELARRVEESLPD